MIGRRQLLMGAGALLSGALFASSPSGRSYEEPDDMYEALHRQRGTALVVAGGRINVVFADGAPGLDRGGGPLGQHSLRSDCGARRAYSIDYSSITPQLRAPRRLPHRGGEARSIRSKRSSDRGPAPRAMSGKSRPAQLRWVGHASG